MTVQFTPAPPGIDLAPAPRRSALGLWLQFTLQWLYLLPWIAVYELCDLGTIGECVAEDSWRKHVLTPTRYRLERRGTQQEWAAWADRALEVGTRSALFREQQNRTENAAGNNRYKHKESEPTTFVRQRYYRGIGKGGVAALAAQRGWDVDWKSHTNHQVHIVRRGPINL